MISCLLLTSMNDSKMTVFRCKKELTGVVDRESPSICRHLCTDSNTPRGTLQQDGGEGRFFDTRSLALKSQLNRCSSRKGREERGRGRRERGREDGRDSFTSFFGALRKKVLQPHSPSDQGSASTRQGSREFRTRL